MFASYSSFFGVTLKDFHDLFLNVHSLDELIGAFVVVVSQFAAWYIFQSKINPEGDPLLGTYVMFCAILYHLYNLKNVKTPMEECYF